MGLGDLFRGSVMGKILQLNDIPTGEPLSDGLYDGQGVLLLRRGSVVTPDQIKSFALKGLRYFELGSPYEPTDDKESAVATLDEAAAPVERPSAASESSDSRLSAAVTPIEQAASPDVHASAYVRPLNPESVVRVGQLVQRAAETVEELGRSLAEGTLRDATPIRETADSFLKEIQDDSDLVIATSLRQAADQQLAIRCVQLSVLSMAIARSMNLTTEEQATAGAAAMLHDMALFQLPENERHSRGDMKPEYRRIYESHPAIAYDMLENVRDIDGSVRIVVLQVHEQADGSGFPRRITIARIHKLARVVNLADAYLTLVGCGEGGQRIIPADALAYLMHHSCAGRFDSAATCGLVRAISLYPLGSLVQLSNNRYAKVVRVVDGQPTKPIVSVEDNDGKPNLVKLADSDLVITRPSNSEELGQRRIATSDLDKILW